MADVAFPLPARQAPNSRGQLLHRSLLPTLEFLNQGQADKIGDGFIADYLALDWLTWNSGTFRLTVAGRNIYDQMRAGFDQPLPV